MKITRLPLIETIRLEFNFSVFYWTKSFMLNLNWNGTWTSFLYIKNSFFNLKRNLKLGTFDHGPFLYKVQELLLITLQQHRYAIDVPGTLGPCNSPKNPDTELFSSSFVGWKTAFKFSCLSEITGFLQISHWLLQAKA